MDYLNPEGGVIVTPDPGYVLKGIIDSSETDKRKIFINVCSSPDIASPTEAFSENQPGNGIRIPMSIGPIIVDTDSKNNVCSVVDVIMGLESLAASLQDPALIEFIASSVSSKYSNDLKADIKNIRFIKRKYRGDSVRSQRLRAKNIAIHESASTVLHAASHFIPPFTIFLVPRNQEGCPPLDVLSLREYLSTDMLLKEALQRQLSGRKGKPSDIDFRREYESCIVRLFNVFQPNNIRLEVSEERVVFWISRAGISEPTSIWFPTPMLPETASAIYNSEKREVIVTVAVA